MILSTILSVVSYKSVEIISIEKKLSFVPGDLY